MKKPSANKKAKTDDANSKVRKREDDKEDDGIDSRNSVHLQTRWPMMEEDDDNGILLRNAWHVVPHVVPLRLPVGALPSGVRTRDIEDGRAGLELVETGGEGNCLFHSTAYHLRTTHEEVRRRVVDELCTNPNLYRDFIPGWGENGDIIDNGDYNDYVISMSELGQWGDQVTLRAVANAYRQTFNVVSMGNGNVTTYTPDTLSDDASVTSVIQTSDTLSDDASVTSVIQTSDPAFTLAYVNGNHYMATTTRPLNGNTVTRDNDDDDNEDEVRRHTNVAV